MGKYLDRLRRNFNPVKKYIHLRVDETTQFTGVIPYNQYLVSANTFVIAHFVCPVCMVNYFGYLIKNGLTLFPEGILRIIERDRHTDLDVCSLLAYKEEMNHFENYDSIPEIDFEVKTETIENEYEPNNEKRLIKRLEVGGIEYKQYIISINGFMIAHFVCPDSANAFMKFLNQYGIKFFPKNILSILKNQLNG